MDGVLCWIGGVVGDGFVDGGNVEVAETEVAVAGPIGVGSPGGVTLVREVVFIDLCAGGERVPLLHGFTDEKASVGEGFVVADLLVFGGIGLDGELDCFGPEAFVAAGKRLVDCGFESRGIDWLFAPNRKGEEPGQHERQGDSFTHSTHLRDLDAGISRGRLDETLETDSG